MPRQDFEVKPYSWLFWGSLGHTVANEQDFYYGKTTNDGMKRGKCKNDKSTVCLLGQYTDKSAQSHVNTDVSDFQNLNLHLVCTKIMKFTKNDWSHYSK